MQQILSIIIPIYRVEKYIKQCTESLFSGDTQEIEYIFVDDCTPDNSMEIIREQIKNFNIPDERVRILKNDKNSGLSVTRNNGVAAAEGTYIWFVDSDDWIDPQRLPDLIDILKTHHPQLLTFGVERTDADTYHEFYNPAIKKYSGVFPGKELLFRISPCAQFYIVERQFWADNNFAFFPGIYHEDTELTPRIKYLAEQTMVYPETVYYYRITPGSIVAVPRLKRALDLLTVCEHLFDFTMQHVGNDDRRSFAEIIAIAYVSSLRIVACLPVSEQKVYLNDSKLYKKILSLFDYCPKLRHRLLGKVMRFPFAEQLFICLLSIAIKVKF